MEELTQRSDIRRLTMLNRRSILSPRELLRRRRAWCPLCFASWHDSGRAVYEPLLWTPEVIKLCPLHHNRLQVQCPYNDCARPQSMLAARMRCGFCSTCHRWLGASGIDSIDKRNDGEASCAKDSKHRRQLKLLTHVEQMISLGAEPSVVTRTLPSLSAW